MAKKNLKNTILIENEEYNINAVNSKVAEQVKNPLVVKKSGVREFTFDGSVEGQTIDYVPTSGGTYSGYVHITGTADMTNDPAYDSAVMTSGQVTNRIVNLNGSPICIWNADNNYQMHSLKDGNDRVYKLTTVVGTSDSFEAFKNYTNNLSKGLSFTLNKDKKTCYVSGMGSCTDSVVHVPEYSDAGVPVTHIGDVAFKNNTQLTEIAIPCGITYIGASAFYGCTSLQRVTLSDSVSRIEESAFYGCTNLTDVLLGAGLKSIAFHAFHGCTNLGGITLPDGLTEIAYGSFFECENLGSIIIPDGVTHIGSTAFCKCTNLTNVVIPKSVISIDYGAFAECTSLTSKVDPELNPGISYSGTEAEWNAFIATEWDDSTKRGVNKSQNNYLLDATLVEQNFEYPQDSTSTGGVVNVSDIANGPFLYICRDLDEEFNPPNKIYIKLPGDDTITELSKDATYLSSNYTTDHYTYEGLAEIIARINKRLEAIGGEELKVTKTDILSSVPTIKDVNALVPEVEVKEYFDPASIPTIQELNDIVKAIRSDLNDLTAEVTYELEHSQNNHIFTANSRIDTLEDKLKKLQPLFDSFVSKIEYPDTIEWTD